MGLGCTEPREAFQRNWRRDVTESSDPGKRRSPPSIRTSHASQRHFAIFREKAFHLGSDLPLSLRYFLGAVVNGLYFSFCLWVTCIYPFQAYDTRRPKLLATLASSRLLVSGEAVAASLVSDVWGTFLSLPLSLSVSLPLSLSACLSTPVCLSLRLCLCLSVSPPLSVSLSASVSVCLSLCLCLCLPVSPPLSLSVSPPVSSVCLSASVSVCLSVSLPLSLSICLSTSVSLPLCLVSLSLLFCLRSCTVRAGPHCDLMLLL